MSEPSFDPDCDFCAIARGRASTPGLVAEGHLWVAFTPLEPATTGHTLVIPRAHVSDLWHAGNDLASTLTSAVVCVGRAIQDALDPEGMNLITSAGPAAEQTVFHLHLHLVPRWPTDGFGPIWPSSHRHQDATRADAAARIRQAYDQLRNDG
jgi:histidine triad (HIT) family protein